MSKPRVILGRLPTSTQDLMHRMAALQPDDLARLRTVLHGWRQGGEEPSRVAARVVFALIQTDDVERAYLAFETVTGLTP